MGIVQQAARAGYGQHAVLPDFLLLRLSANRCPAAICAVKRGCRCRPAALGAFESVAAVTAVVPHSASELTFTRQQAGGGAGGDADGGAAAAEATYRCQRQRMHGSVKGGGGRA
jgi:hypothetical protein